MRPGGPLDYLEGRKFCVVFVKILDLLKERVQLRCLRGRASIERGKLQVMAPTGNIFTVPSSAIPTIQPNDGTEILKDAEFYCLVKVDENVQLEDGDLVVS
ncbi:MAG: hypothetical protein J6866_08550 [Victivallales bacterium]|nr:hypothetical protein [Victivallales bacterium]